MWHVLCAVPMLIAACNPVVWSICVVRCIAEQMNAVDLGNVAWAMHQVGLSDFTLMAAVATCAERLGQGLDWQAVAHLDNLFSSVDHAAHRAKAQLDVQGPVAVKAVQSALQVNVAKITKAVMEAAPWSSQDFKSARPAKVLVVNTFAAEVVEQIAAAGPAVLHWSRYVSGVAARAWPKSKKVGACIARMPHTKASTQMMIGAMLSVLEEGGSVWIVGTPIEGVHSVKAMLSAQFQSVVVASSSADAVVIRGISKTAPTAGAATPSLKDFRFKSTLPLEGTDQKWVSYPGLFANGQVDVMTAAMMAQLPAPKAGADVLDYCSGSGVIGRTLQLRSPGATIHLLDNDAVAMEAAAKNATGASFHLSDGFAALAGKKFDLIVSNPPVHQGLDSDFSILANFLADGPKHLKPDGKMYFVVQSYVPVRAMLTKTYMLGTTRLHRLWTDGRFAVWAIKAKGGSSDDGDAGLVAATAAVTPAANAAASRAAAAAAADTKTAAVPNHQLATVEAEKTAPPPTTSASDLKATALRATVISAESTPPSPAAAVAHAVEMKQLKAARRNADDDDDEDEVERLSKRIKALKASGDQEAAWREAELKQLKAARRKADDDDDEDEVERLSTRIKALKAVPAAGALAPKPAAAAPPVVVVTPPLPVVSTVSTSPVTAVVGDEDKSQKKRKANRRGSGKGRATSTTPATPAAAAKPTLVAVAATASSSTAAVEDEGTPRKKRKANRRGGGKKGGTASTPSAVAAVLAVKPAWAAPVATKAPSEDANSALTSAEQATMAFYAAQADTSTPPAAAAVAVGDDKARKKRKPNRRGSGKGKKP